MEENEDFDFGGDFGDFSEFDTEINESDLDLFTFAGDDDSDSRYQKPAFKAMRTRNILYDNARRLAKELRVEEGDRFNCFVAGNFIFGDFIEAYITEHNVKCRRLLISTLSLSEENIDSLKNLLEGNFVDKLDLITSQFFYANERYRLVPYLYQELDIDDRFQFAVAGTHTKTAQFETAGGKKIVIHGSANMRSSGNIEQFTIEENPELYQFYEQHFDNILSEYSTIKKEIRHNKLWQVFNK